MAELLRARWESTFEGASRRDRRGCEYDTYLPDPLLGWDLALPGDLAADIADAEQAVRHLNDAGTRHASLEGLARFLLRAESVASSKIEGLHAAPRRLLEAEVSLAQGGDAADRIAVEVLGNIAAQQTAVELATRNKDFDLDALLEIHRVLMERSDYPQYAGIVREVQNWIGGSGYNPCSATFVPPPVEYLGSLLDDLITYVNGDEHSPLVQAALAHAQFETIHPFVDGNGRTGRTLIHVVFKRRGLAPSFVPPVSLVLATWSKDYIHGLTTYRHVGPADAPTRSEAAHTWLRTFASATLRACRDAERFADQIDEITAGWREQLGRVRADSAINRIIEVVPGAPIITVESAARLVDRSIVRTGEAINRLVDAGVLRQRNVGRQRYRVFEATDILGLFTNLERALASPTGNTQHEPPVRPVPAPPTVET
jgi:Fic family protein